MSADGSVSTPNYSNLVEYVKCPPKNIKVRDEGGKVYTNFSVDSSYECSLALSQAEQI